MTSLTLTAKYLMNPVGDTLNIPVPVRLMSPALMLVAVIGDLRMRSLGPLTGNRRLWRHLWRMCYAMLVATSSFFLGQPKFIPEPLKNWPTRITLAVLPLVMMLYWLARVRSRRGYFDIRLPTPTTQASIT